MENPSVIKDFLICGLAIFASVLCVVIIGLVEQVRELKDELVKWLQGP